MHIDSRIRRCNACASHNEHKSAVHHIQEEDEQVSRVNVHVKDCTKVSDFLKTLKIGKDAVYRVLYHLISYRLAVNTYYSTHITIQNIKSHILHYRFLVFSQSLTNTIHKTQAAAEKHNDVWCYSCHSMEDGDICIENITANYSSFMKKCKDDEYICMVRKYSYTTSTENATSGAKLWSLERRCANNCEAGCIVIGERTKLYACTDCCNSSYCNSGKGASAPPRLSTHNCIILAVTVIHCLHRFMHFDWIYAVKTKMPHIVTG